MLLRTEVCAGPLKIAILPQVLTIEPRFVGKGCAGQLKIAVLLQFFYDRTSFRAKGLRRTLENRIFSIFDDRTSLCAKGLRRTTQNRSFTSVFFTIEPHFVRKGCARHL